MATDAMYCNAQDVSNVLTSGKDIIKSDTNHSVFQVTQSEMDALIKQATTTIIRKTASYFPLAAFSYTEKHRIPKGLRNGFVTKQQYIERGRTYRRIYFCSFVPGADVTSVSVVVPSGTDKTVTDFIVAEDKRSISISELEFTNVFGAEITIVLNFTTPGLVEIPSNAKYAAANYVAKELLGRYASQKYFSSSNSKLSAFERKKQYEKAYKDGYSEFDNSSTVCLAFVSFLQSDPYALRTRG